MHIHMASLFNALMALNGVCTHAFSRTRLIIQRSMFIHCVTGILVLTQWSCRVLLATIRDKGLCPCPRCLIEKTKIDLLGQVRDLAQRISHSRSILYDGVQTARRFIYQLATPINGTAVDQLLKPTSSVPTVVRHVSLLIVLSLTISTVECFHTTPWSELQCR
jgi:hypothetical protein